MEEWIRWARGPLFWTAVTFMVLGLSRTLILTACDAVRVWRRAGDRRLDTRTVGLATLKWLIPIRRLGNRWPYSLTTIVFHLAVIVVPLFLAGHIELLRAATGLSWPAIPNALATGLTMTAVIAALAIVVQRAASRAANTLSRLQDYAIPLLIGLVFLSGLLVMHPTWNPLATDLTLLVHALSADLLLCLVPLTKLSHMVLLPLTQLVSELAWHFPDDAGRQVAAVLGKEQEPL